MGVQHGCMYIYVAMCVYFTHMKYVCIHIVCMCTQSWPSVCDPMVCSPPGSSVPGISQARILEWVAIFLLQGVFPTLELNPGLPHCRWIFYQLNHKGCPRILEWIATSFSSGSSQARDRTQVSRIVERCFTI